VYITARQANHDYVASLDAAEAQRRSKAGHIRGKIVPKII